MKRLTLALTMVSLTFFQNVLAQQAEAQPPRSTQGDTPECTRQFNACLDTWNHLNKTRDYQACEDTCHKAMIECKQNKLRAGGAKDSLFERAKRHKLDCANKLQKISPTSTSKK